MNYNQLTREQRYAIFLGLQEGKSQSAIACLIGVSPSTISREIHRNKGKTGRYNWRKADQYATIRKERLPGNRTVKPDIMRTALKLLVEEDWSPRQISGHLALGKINISHESIYDRIRKDVSGELRRHCRHGMKYRRHVKSIRPTKVRNIPERTSIHERPPAADGKRFGDWEMDLVLGKRQKEALLTLCERSCNYMMMCKLPDKHPETVSKAVISLLIPYKENVLTITTDNGSEFASHRTITKALGAKVYFADSYASWQKGAIENTNKLIRQYIPKGTDLNTVSDDFVKMIQYKLNRRPREKLNFSSPKNVFFKFFS